MLNEFKYQVSFLKDTKLFETDLMNECIQSLFESGCAILDRKLDFTCDWLGDFFIFWKAALIETESYREKSLTDEMIDIAIDRLSITYSENRNGVIYFREAA
jgi:hypothetical protein